MKTFTIVPEHLAMLRQANISWNHTEYGAPCMDPKRPYGNSTPERDIHHILQPGSLDAPSSVAQTQYQQLHRQLETVLQIACHVGFLEVGEYRRQDFEHPWEPIPSTLQASVRRACQTVERLARSVGPDCQIILTKGGVEIAPLADAGSTTAPTLDEALRLALIR